MRLRYFGQQNRDRLSFLPEGLVACAVGASAMAFLVSAFGLDWGPAKLFSGNPLEGLLSAWNRVAERLGESEYFILPRFARGYLEGGEPAPQGLFLTCALLVVILLAYLILRSGNRWLLLILLVPPAALLLLTGIGPQVIPGTAFFGALLLCFCLMGGSEEARTIDGRSRLWGLALPAAVVLLLILGGGIVDHFVGAPSSSLQIKASEEIENVLDLRYGRNPLGSGRLNRLDGKTLTQRRGQAREAIRQMKEGGEDPSQTALEVTADQPDAWYLRGFVGERYSGGAWSPLDKGTVYLQRDTEYWLNRQGFDGLSQMGKAAELAGKPARETGLKIRIGKADRSLVYLPYEALGMEDGIPKGTENYGGNYLRSSRPFGSRTVEYSAGENLTGQWTDLVGGLYSAKKDEALDTYFINESHYNRWCYEQYTQVPPRLKAEVSRLIGSPGDIRRNHAPYRETIASVLGVLKDNFIYSESFERTEGREDPLDRFLATGRGCDAHYASLAAMMFRTCGIPARYVEGYLVTPSDVSSGKTAKIGFSHAHAWTEIYIDGFGWVPLEVTPEYEGIMPQADMDRGLESIQWENRPQPQNQIPPDELEEEMDDTQLGSRVIRILKWILLGLLLLLLLLAALLLLRRYLILRARRKTFEDPDPRKGVCAMYGYMRNRGVPVSESARVIGDLAAFSTLEVSERLRSIMREELERGENEKKQMDKSNSGSVSDRIAALLRSLRRG